MLEKIEQLKNKAKIYPIENLEDLENYRLIFFFKSYLIFLILRNEYICFSNFD